jgi:hypothetical protein
MCRSWRRPIAIVATPITVASTPNAMAIFGGGPETNLIGISVCIQEPGEEVDGFEATKGSLEADIERVKTPQTDNVLLDYGW